MKFELLLEKKIPKDCYQTGITGASSLFSEELVLLENTLYAKGVFLFLLQSCETEEKKSQVGSGERRHYYNTKKHLKAPEK